MEKRKEIPIMTLDEIGVITLQKEIALKEDELMELRKKKRVAFSNTDTDGWNTPKFSENADERILHYEIDRLKSILDKAVIIGNSSDSLENIVNLNDVVEVNLIYSEDDTERMILRLGTVHQANPEDGIEVISLESKLGKALHKAKVGTIVSFGDKGEFRADILNKINEHEKVAAEKIKK